MAVDTGAALVPDGRLGVRIRAEGMSFAGLLRLMTRWQNLSGVLSGLDREQIASVYEQVEEKRPKTALMAPSEDSAKAKKRRVSPQAQGWAYGRTTTVSEFDRGSLIVWLSENASLVNATAGYLTVGWFTAKLLGFAMRLVRAEGDPEPQVDSTESEPSPLLEDLFSQAAATPGTPTDKIEWFFRQAAIQGILPPDASRRELAKRVVEQAEEMRHIQ